MLEYAISVGRPGKYLKLTPEHGKPGPAVHRCRQVLATEKVPSWQLKAFEYYYMPMKDAGLAASWLSRPPSEAAEETDSHDSWRQPARLRDHTLTVTQPPYCLCASNSTRGKQFRGACEV
jgi:hypothetical protein